MPRLFRFTFIILQIVLASYAQAQEPKIILPLGHADAVRMAVYSPDGKTVATASNDQTAKIWDATSGKLLRTMEGHTDKVFSVAYSKDGKWIVTASSDRTLRKWDATTGESVQTIKGAAPFNTAVFSPDGKLILASCWDKTAKLYDATTGALKHTLQGHKANVADASFSQDGKFMVTASWDRTAKTWNADGMELKTFACGADVITASLSPDGKKLVTAGYDGKVTVWDAATGAMIKELEIVSPYLYSARFSPDGKFIITSQDNGAIVWNAETADRAYTVVPGHKHMVRYAAFSEDGKYIVTASIDKTAKICEAGTGKLRHNLDSKTTKFASSVFSDDGRYTLTACDDNTAKMWETKTGKLVRVLTGHKAPVNIALFSHDVQYIATGSEDNTVRIWETATGKQLQQFENNSKTIVEDVFDTTIIRLPAKVNSVNSLAFSPDDKYIVAACDSLGKVWEVETGDLVHTLVGHREAIYCVAYSPDGNMIATASRDKTVKLWKATGEPFPGTFTHTGPAYSVAFSPDSKLIVTGGTESGVKIWSVNGGLRRTVDARTDIVYSVSFSPDGSNIAASCSNNATLVWNVTTGQLVQALKGHTNDVCYVAYNKTGTRLITSAGDHTMRTWDAANGKLLYTLANIGGSDYIFVSPANFYLGTKGAANKVSFRIGQNVFPFDQFDLQYNRPDRMLAAFGNTDTTLISNYRMAWLKRLQRSGFSEADFEGAYHLPEMELTVIPPTQTSEPVLQLSFNAKDATYALESYSVCVNNVPAGGASIRKLNVHESKNNVAVSLSAGLNKIQASCRNIKGTESLKKTVYVNYTPKKPVVSKTYFIGIGVSNYYDANYQLQFAAKDIRDLAASIKAKMPDCSIDTFIDTKVTKEILVALKQKLLKTNIEDRVILAVCGHGLLDSLKDFYYASYDCDFKHPASKAISYEKLEGLLDGIPARRKILLLDACHSGEVDKEEAKQMAGTLAMNDKKPSTTTGKSRGGDVENSQVGLQNSFDLMQDLFSNLSQGNGAMVISAAKGNQTAQEGGGISNGWFSYSVMQAFKDEKADKNQDKKLSVVELQEYVNAKVIELSQGMQTPTARQELLDYDWILW